jgi:BirA family biotin operon repressor/biotin-[acetyl-CoA-carboxylase] ligase
VLLAIERGQPVPRALFAAALLSELEQWLDLHAAEGFGPIRDAWRERSVTLGREVRVDGDRGEIAGVAVDIDDSGALLVRGRAGVTRVVAGDVRLVGRVDPAGA